MASPDVRQACFGSTGGVACLIALIPVASTLPAHAWLAPADDRRPAEANNPASPPGQHPQQQGKPSASLEAAPPTYVWDANSARAGSTGSGPVLLAALPPLCARIPPVDHNLYARVAARTPGARTQRRWLTCRYAHAPPLGA